MPDLMTLLSCFEDQWSSCSLLLQDMTRQEQSKAAFRVLNDPGISDFLPRPPTPPPTPPPTTSPLATTTTPYVRTATISAVATTSVEVKKEAVEAKRKSKKVFKRRQIKKELSDPLKPASGNAETNKEALKKKQTNLSQVSKINIKKEIIENSHKVNGSNVQIKKEFIQKKRRKGNVFTDLQKFELNRSFEQNAYPSPVVRNRLELELGLNRKQLTAWFMNKRTVEGIKNGQTSSETTKQLEFLNKKFSENSYPSKEERLELVRKTNFTEIQVSAWFNKKRTAEGVRRPKKIQCVDLEKKEQRPRLLKSQSVLLEQLYLEKGPLDSTQVRSLAKELGLRTQQCKIWFYNRHKNVRGRTSGR